MPVIPLLQLLPLSTISTSQLHRRLPLFVAMLFLTCTTTTATATAAATRSLMKTLSSSKSCGSRRANTSLLLLLRTRGGQTAAAFSWSGAICAAAGGSRRGTAISATTRMTATTASLLTRAGFGGRGGGGGAEGQRRGRVNTALAFSSATSAGHTTTSCVSSSSSCVGRSSSSSSSSSTSAQQRQGHFPLFASYLGAVALYSSFNNGGEKGGEDSTTAACEAAASIPSKEGGRKQPRTVTGTEPPPKELYPPLQAFRTGMLPVSAVHTLYWEESGNPQGKPVVFLHGGPGGGTAPDFRRYFDPAVYRIVIFDQRGCGRSTPHASLEENTTWDMVEDIEKLRLHLGIDRWTVFGGSWGSTLSLTYAITHPERVTELVLRGIFMLRHKELAWYYQEGASWIYPDAFEPYLEHIPEAERGDLMLAYNKRLTSPDARVRLPAAREWTRWEMATSRLIPDQVVINKADDDDFSLAFARIENHFFINRGFFPYDDWILK
ncbi:hypothetical protein VYU27_007237 [Nannochloropsis oceanica]